MASVPEGSIYADIEPHGNACTSAESNDAACRSDRRLESGEHGLGLGESLSCLGLFKGLKFEGQLVSVCL